MRASRWAVMAAVGLGLMLAVETASADPANQPEAAAPQQRQRRPGGERMNREELRKRFDKNGNGQLDPEEQQAARAAMQQRGGPGGPGGQQMSREEMRKKFDKNGNGRLDPEELQAARAAMPQRGGPGGPGGPRMSREEMLKKFDKNGNGQLDPEELQAARAAMQQQPGGPGRRRPPAAGEDGQPRPNRPNRPANSN